MEECKQLIFGLCAEPGTPGDEQAAAQFAAQALRECGETRIDAMGNVICEMGRRDAKEHILLDAHLDQIGLVVTGIEEHGFLRIAKTGGVDRRVLPGSVVKVYGREVLQGVVCCMPPHLLEKGEDKIPDVDKLYIDAGLTREEAKRLVSPGDRAVFCTVPRALLGTRMTSSALDDRAGCAALIQCARLLKGRELDCALTILLSGREEVGGQGAATAAFAAAPTQAIMVDVSFAEQPGVAPEKGGKLGGGAMIGFAPILHRDMCRALVQLAKRDNIPFTYEVMGGTTGTNTDQVAVSRAGVRCGLLSIPLRYMHTPAEVIDLQDVDATARLLAAYVREVR